MTESLEPSTGPGGPDHDALPEGDERVPPGTRAAAIVRWALVAAMAIAAVSAWTCHAVSGVAGGGARFHCPMHPTVVMEQKGECPICGMDLVPVAKGGAVATHAPASGATPAATSPSTAARGFTCPMHLGFVTDDPKARCPECGMKLVPNDAGAAPEHAAHAAGVPGLAPVELTAERIQLAGVKTAVAIREQLRPTIRTVGFVAASENAVVSVNARVSGWIDSVGGAAVGQLVNKGDILATISSGDALTAQQQFLATARWSEARAAAASGGSTPQYEVAREARQRLELLGFAPEDIEALAAAGKPSSAVVVRAPARGHVARRAVLRGTLVQPGAELFQIADLSTVWVLADVHESELGRVKVGQRATVELAAYPGERFAGRVAFLYPALSEASRTLQARIELRNGALALRPGMYADVTLEAGATEAIVVPADAVVDTGEVQHVFVARGNGRFEPRRVRTGASGGGRVAVLEGLAEGERVVTAATFLLDSESRLAAALEGSAAP